MCISNVYLSEFSPTCCLFSTNEHAFASYVIYRQLLPTESQLGQQAYQILKVCSTYHGLGIVQLLPCQNTYHGAVTVQSQIDYILELRRDVTSAQQRHCVFLSGKYSRGLHKLPKKKLCGKRWYVFCLTTS